MSEKNGHMPRSITFPRSSMKTSLPAISRQGSKIQSMPPSTAEKPRTLKRETSTLHLYVDLKNKNAELQKQRDDAMQELDSIRKKIDLLAHRNSHLERDFNNDWGKIIRGKDEEIRRCKEEIRKLEIDRGGVMMQKTIVETSLIDLKDRLKEKNEKISGIKQIQRVQSKSKLISDTERIRNERNEALASLDQREKLVNSMKLQLLQLNKLNEQRTKQLAVLQKRMSSKEKYVKELEKQLMTYNSGIFFDYFRKSKGNTESAENGASSKN